MSRINGFVGWSAPQRIYSTAGRTTAQRGSAIDRPAAVRYYSAVSRRRRRRPPRPGGEETRRRQKRRGGLSPKPSPSPHSRMHGGGGGGGPDIATPDARKALKDSSGGRRPASPISHREGKSPHDASSPNPSLLGRRGGGSSWWQLISSRAGWE